MRADKRERKKLFNFQHLSIRLGPPADVSEEILRTNLQKQNRPIYQDLHDVTSMVIPFADLGRMFSSMELTHGSSLFDPKNGNISTTF